MDTATEPLVAREEGPPKKDAKNSVLKTAFLVVANCAGSGLLSLPKAFNQASLTGGVVVTIAAALLSAYTADILGRCYDMMHHERGEGKSGAADDEHEGASFLARSPYAAVGQRAAGRVGAVAVTVAQVMTQFSVLVLFLLISGVNLHKLAPSHGSTLGFSLACTAGLTPFMLLRPGEVWTTAVLAVLASVVLVGVVVVLCATGAPHDPWQPPSAVDFSSFGSAFGVILFGFGGHAILPALQNAMARPTPARFRRAIGGSFAVCLAMYLATAVASNVTLGGAIQGDVLTSFSGTVNDFGLVAVTCHLLFAAVTVHIPLGEILDHYAGVRAGGGRQLAVRCATMTLVVLFIWAIGSHFYCVVGIVGGTCNNAMIFVFPPLFYLRLRAQQRERAGSGVGELSEVLVGMCGIVAVGTAGMASALIGAADTCSGT
eukprot:g3812.t1